MDGTPGTSRQHQCVDHATSNDPVNEMIRSAERSQARIFDVAGNTEKGVSASFEGLLQHELFHSVVVDEDYLVVGTHVDETTKHKIISGEYIDFARLILQNRVSAEDDHHMEMVNYGGHTFWVPASDRTAISINSFSKWEQAFRVFSNIYTREYPNRSSELIQYNHVIHTASLNFQWDNVYHYDKEFRFHLARHPERSWSVILQQAWTMYLKDRPLSTIVTTTREEVG